MLDSYAYAGWTNINSSGLPKVLHRRCKLMLCFSAQNTPMQALAQGAPLCVSATQGCLSSNGYVTVVYIATSTADATLPMLYFNAHTVVCHTHTSTCASAVSAPSKDALVMKCIHSAASVERLFATRAVCTTAPARLKRHHCSQEDLPLLLVTPFQHGSAALSRSNITAVEEACILAVAVTDVTSAQPLRACRLVTCTASETQTQPHVYMPSNSQQTLVGAQHLAGWQQAVWVQKGSYNAQPCSCSAAELHSSMRCMSRKQQLGGKGCVHSAGGAAGSQHDAAQPRLSMPVTKYAAPRCCIARCAWHRDSRLKAAWAWLVGTYLDIQQSSLCL
jgi:hypothetical protein